MFAAVRAVSNYEDLKNIIALPTSFQGKKLQVTVAPIQSKQDKTKFFSARGKIHLDQNEVIANREQSKL